jgi:hypothetical protein
MTNETPRCEICGEPMPSGEEMFKLHGYSGPCPKPPLPRRTVSDAIREAEQLLELTLNQLNAEHERDQWFAVRVTKIREALADRPND